MISARAVRPVSPEAVYASGAVYVYLNADRHPSLQLTPEDARSLGEQLIDCAEWLRLRRCRSSEPIDLRSE